MSDIPVHVNLEKVDENAIITTTGYWWPDVAGEKVSKVFDNTGQWGAWRSFKLYYGVQPRQFSKPENLKLFTVTDAEDTMGELFKDTHLEPGYEYYLLISKLPKTLEDFTKKNPEHVIYYKKCADRYNMSSQMHPISCSLAKLTHYT